MSTTCSPRPASATGPKPSPTPTSTGSPEPSPRRPGPSRNGQAAGQEQDATPSAWSRQQRGSRRRRSLYAGQLAISASAKPSELAHLSSPFTSRTDNEERPESAGRQQVGLKSDHARCLGQVSAGCASIRRSERIGGRLTPP